MAQTTLSFRSIRENYFLLSNSKFTPTLNGFFSLLPMLLDDFDTELQGVFHILCRGVFVLNMHASA